MQAEDKIRLQHILQEANQAIHFVKDLEYDEFSKDPKTVRAVMRCVEVIGEASSKLSDELRESNPQIPWRKIIGMRNRLIHVYFDIDYPIIWQTVKGNLPPLIIQIQSILNKR